MRKKSPFSLVGKTILITGASSGIGRQIAISAAEEGARLIIIGRNKDRLSATIKLVKKGAIVFSHLLDITEEQSIYKFVSELKKKGLLVDGIVHSAGISTTLPFKLSTSERQNAFFQINVVGPLNLTKELAKKGAGLINGASIIFISSVMSVVGEKGKTLYSMSKGALTSASKSMALEFASRKIRVNAISPGVIKSPMSDNAVYSQDDETLKKITDKHPLGLGNVEDVANACVYLLSDASKWVTGSNLIIDGGYTAQ